MPSQLMKMYRLLMEKLCGNRESGWMELGNMVYGNVVYGIVFDENGYVTAYWMTQLIFNDGSL